MVPFPRLHFFTVALAPLTSETGAKYRSSNVSELVQQLFSPSNVCRTSFSLSFILLSSLLTPTSSDHGRMRPKTWRLFDIRLHVQGPRHPSLRRRNRHRQHSTQQRVFLRAVGPQQHHDLFVRRTTARPKICSNSRRQQHSHCRGLQTQSGSVLGYGPKKSFPSLGLSERFTWWEHMLILLFEILSIQLKAWSK